MEIVNLGTVLPAIPDGTVGSLTKRIRALPYLTSTVSTILPIAHLLNKSSHGFTWAIVLTHDADINQPRETAHEGVDIGIFAVFIQDTAADIHAGASIEDFIKIVLCVMICFNHDFLPFVFVRLVCGGCYIDIKQFVFTLITVSISWHWQNLNNLLRLNLIIVQPFKQFSSTLKKTFVCT